MADTSRPNPDSSAKQTFKQVSVLTIDTTVTEVKP